MVVRGLGEEVPKWNGNEITYGECADFGREVIPAVLGLLIFFEFGTDTIKLWLVQGLLCKKINHIRKRKMRATFKHKRNSDFLTPYPGRDHPSYHTRSMFEVQDLSLKLKPLIPFTY